MTKSSHPIQNRSTPNQQLSATWGLRRADGTNRKTNPKTSNQKEQLSLSTTWSYQKSREFEKSQLLEPSPTWSTLNQHPPAIPGLRRAGASSPATPPGPTEKTNPEISNQKGS